MLADEQVGVGSIGTPAHGTIYYVPISELWQETSHSLSNSDLGSIWVGVGGMAGVRSGNRDELGMGGAKWLMLLEVCESWKLVTDLDDTVSEGPCQHTLLALGDSSYSLGSKKNP